MNVERADPSANLDKITSFAEEAASRGSRLLCLPEMATTGFDWKANREMLNEAQAHHQALSDIAREQSIGLCGSFLEKTESGNPANTLLYFNPSGERTAKYRKIHLFTLFREERHVESG